MKTNTPRPWIDKNGRPLTDAKLRLLSRAWDTETWEAYLHWFEKPSKECLVSSEFYDLTCESRTDTVYQEYGPSTADSALQKYVERLLTSLPEIEEKALRLFFFEGLTQREVAISLKRSQGGIHLIKNRAIFRLQSKTSEAELITIHIMRGPGSQNEIERPSIWECESSDPARENRPYFPENWSAELLTIQNAPLREAIRELYEGQRQTLYLHFWCAQPITQVAQRLAVGINVAQEICDAAVFKVKSQVASKMKPKTEVPSCA